MEFDKNKIKFKIAISKIKEENDIVMKNRVKNIFKAIVTAVAGIILSTGVVFAGTKVYESIWKTPEKIESLTDEITEESKKENITEEQAKEIAVNKLKEIGFNSNIVNTNHYKEIDSNKIMYRFDKEENYEVSINGQTGEFYDIWNNNKNIQDINTTITEQEAIDVANKYYKLFGFTDGEYEITRIYSNNNDGSGKGDGYKIDITYNKKYGEVHNPYESISIGIESKNKDIHYFRVENNPFDNNEIAITKDEAIQIALNEDKKIETNNIVETKAQKMIVKMNADAYERINNKDKYYEVMQNANYPNEERNYYNIENKIRNAWVVVITYEDTYEDVEKRYTEGKYSYFVDATTGEIIGGHTMDYIESFAR
jgi:hypothetical protein